MSPSKIFRILDLALTARKQNHVFNPLFTGEAGLGKSFICQQWVKEQQKLDPSFGFIDLRIAYLEAPDMIGFPKETVDENGRSRTSTNLPSFWPTSGRGLLLLEEPNRGNQSVMNCLMQLLTDRKLHDYVLPDGWVIAGCINPENGNYDVNTMDTALLNRFIPYEITFDFKAFLDYAKNSNMHPNVITFISSNAWTYQKSDAISATGKYIAPRTWSQVSSAEYAMTEMKASQNEHFDAVNSILGYDIGKAYHSFTFDQAPVLAKDLKENSEKALIKLKSQVERNSYKGDLIAATVSSIVDAMPNFPFDVMLEVMKIIPADQAVTLIEQHIMKDPDEHYNLPALRKKYPELVKIIKTGLIRAQQKDVVEEKNGKTKA